MLRAFFFHASFAITITMPSAMLPRRRRHAVRMLASRARTCRRFDASFLSLTLLLFFRHELFLRFSLTATLCRFFGYCRMPLMFCCLLV